MTEIDVIVPSMAKTKRLYALTMACVDSLMKSETRGTIKFNVFLFEQAYVEYPFRYYRYAGDFNYHRIMNLGLSMGRADFVCLCNNDLQFTAQWATTLLNYKDRYLSMSPRCPVSQPARKYPNPVYEGYGVGAQLSGWCIFAHRGLFDIIGDLDESASFWYSDNLYAEQLKKHNITHALITKSVVYHVNRGSNTLKTLSRQEVLSATKNQKQLYIDAKTQKYSSFDPQTL